MWLNFKTNLGSMNVIHKTHINAQTLPYQGQGMTTDGGSETMDKKQGSF